MSYVPGLLILTAIFLGAATNRFVRTFRQEAVRIALIGLGLGAGLGTHYASQFTDSPFEERVEFVAVSLAISAFITVLTILIMWLVYRRRAT